MSVTVYDQSVGVFVRGLTNLKRLLTKAEAHAAGSGIPEAALLSARLASEDLMQSQTNVAPNDLHMYTLGAQGHWAAEGAKLAVARLLGAPAAPGANDAKTFADLHARVDTTVSYLREIAPEDLEAGIDRTIVVELRRGAVRASGGQFLLAYAVPHFYYHVTTAYGILRNQGVPLTMGDFLGDWGRA